MGARAPRDLPIPGRELRGVHFAMEFLVQQNRRIAGDAAVSRPILATGKHVVVIGGGDTGSDCVGTSIRQGALSVTQLEVMPKPSLVRLPANPWPEWPLILRTSSSQEEGAERDWAVSTRNFRGEGGAVVALETVRVTIEGGKMKHVEGTEFSIPAGLVLLAMGFVGPEKGGVIEQLGLALDARGNVRSDPAAPRTSPASSRPATCRGGSRSSSGPSPTGDASRPASTPGCAARRWRTRSDSRENTGRSEERKVSGSNLPTFRPSCSLSRPGAARCLSSRQPPRSMAWTRARAPSSVGSSTSARFTSVSARFGSPCTRAISPMYW